MKLYSHIAQQVFRLTSKRPEIHDDATSKIVEIEREFLPSGSGVNSGTSLDVFKSTPDKLVFNTAFHHMDDMGGYCGWTSHVVTIRPSLIHGFTLAVSGRDKNGIKEYLADLFSACLDSEFPRA